MGDYYQVLDKPHFAYDLYKISGITNTSFRGPPINRTKPYAACLGAAQTFGRFAARPYPAILAQRLRFPFLNLGVGAAGPLWFQAPQYVKLANNAKFVIVLVLSGRSEGNSLFDNRASGGLMGVRKSDNRLMRFEDFIMELMEAEGRDRAIEIIQETRARYVSDMITLLQRIYRPKILFWFSVRTPEYREQFGSAWELLGDFPQLVNRQMIDMLRPYADSYVECVTSRGMPQKLWQSNKPVDGTTAEDGWLLNRYYPTPDMHQEAADMLAPVCAPYLPTKQPAKRGGGG
jgi:hypothetical protein